MMRVLRLLVAAAMVLGLGACAPFGGNTMTIYAMLSDSAGVFVGNEVGILGVPVGHITAIEPQGTNVKVTMEIDKDQPVPADAGAVVVARSVATDRYIELTPVYHDGPKMAPNTVIEQSRTRTPVEFDEVLKALSDFAVGIGGTRQSRDAVKNFVDTGADVLGGEGPLLNSTLTSLSQAVNGVYGQRGDITSTLVAVDKLTKTLATNPGTVREFIKQGAGASELLAAERTNFRDSLRAVSTAVETMSEFVHTNKDQLVRSLRNTTDVMKILLARRQQLEEILRVMPLGLDNLTHVMHNGSVRVRINPIMLFPLGSALTQVCDALPADLCNTIAGTNPAGLTSLLGDLLGGQG